MSWINYLERINKISDLSLFFDTSDIIEKPKKWPIGIQSFPEDSTDILSSDIEYLVPSPILITKDAKISKDGKYRYYLRRSWGSGYCLPFIMLNPSTADDKVDDPTILKCMKFARREGYSGIVVANLFCYRATDPKELLKVAKPIGDENASHILCDIIKLSYMHDIPIVCAWGAHKLAEERSKEVIDFIKACKLVCLGKNQDGSPKHPLYIKDDTPFQIYP